MDFLTATVLIVAITGATAVLVVRHLSSTPARIAAVLGAIAVLFAVIPRIVEPLSSVPSAPAPSATVTVTPNGQTPIPSATTTSVWSGVPGTGGAL